MKLMGKPPKDNPLKPPPSLEELENFDDTDPNSGPTVDDFCINYHGGAKDRWNIAATNIFVEDFLRSTWGATYSNEKKVEKAFQSHLRSLKKKYKNWLRFKDDECKELKHVSLTARTQRRRRVCSEPFCHDYYFHSLFVPVVLS